MGNAVRLQGLAFEEALAWMHQVYLARDRAAVYHMGTVSQYRRGTWIPEQSLADYMGCIRDLEGRLVAFDAKTLRNGTGKYRHKPAQLHQLDRLGELCRSRAVVFLLVELQPALEVFLLPPRLWPYGVGRVWTGSVDVRKRGIPVPVEEGRVDWLSAVLENLEEWDRPGVTDGGEG